MNTYLPMKVQFACQYLHIIHFLDWFIINPSKTHPLVIPVWRLSLDWRFSERKNEQSEETIRETREELAKVLPTLKECKRTGRLLK